MVNCYFYNEKKILETNKWDVVKELLFKKDIIKYLNVSNPSKNELDMLEELLELHPLTTEDCISTTENPKLEDYENYIFTVLHDINYVEEDDELEKIPINIILNDNSLVVIHNSSNTEIFNEALFRMAANNDTIFKSSSNLYYTLVDTLVDNYFPILTFWGEKLESLEEDILENADTTLIERIIYIRKNLLKVKKSFMAQREVIYRVSHTYINFIEEEHKIYLKDVFDHIIKLCSNLDEYRDWASSLMDAYYSFSSAKLNENMQRLTTISIVFMPLTFIAGVYGMNFEFMPELKWRFGYFGVMGFMLALAVGMVLYFRNKKLF